MYFSETGAHQGAQYGQNERVDELNQRLNSRFVTDYPLQPNIDLRPVSTKYTLFPMVDRHDPYKPKEVLLDYPTYSVGSNFNPGTSVAPSSGYRANVELENVLRNQYFGLQRGAPQAAYIPSTDSDLYKVVVTSNQGHYAEQPYPLLFSNPQFDTKPKPNVENTIIGRDRFYNHTRTQLRNS